MNQIHIVNAAQRTGWPEGTPVYVARPHPLGNPFTAGKHGGKAEVIRKYDEWFEAEVMTAVRSGANTTEAKAYRILAMIREVSDLLLVCWCHPEDCHTHTIKRNLDERRARFPGLDRPAVAPKPMQGLLSGRTR